VHCRGRFHGVLLSTLCRERLEHEFSRRIDNA
jgi:hypothetical protein